MWCNHFFCINFLLIWFEIFFFIPRNHCTTDEGVSLDEFIRLSRGQYEKQLRELTWGIFYNSLLILFILFFGIISFYYMENVKLIDSIYWCVITLSTVGYGDITPKTDEGKLFTAFYVTFGCFAFIIAITNIGKKFNHFLFLSTFLLQSSLLTFELFPSEVSSVIARCL